ncbi:Calcium-dependent lipid-binding (CaLB domain) family protein [Raphanus sativus]|uniref:Actin cytoskeleton-regulatory complex protein PAN1 n=1 Tax=Raphanus sativus TaxID=3726 RepID=A0A6J0P0D7_RAPSA|nr:actin cytoskeleton-regulatory complex protein PAN1 [Raphanus sativus]KAJ4895411.1 Calcium-dependent lipid-binding (CaLB domain) family protein [Raphanus sativus]
MASSEPLDLIVTVVSAKHLKNVNWRNGDLKPYVVLYLDPDHRLSTRSDDSTKPVWNERITLPLTRSVHESVLSIEILHSNSPDLAKSLAGSVRFPLVRLVDSEGAMTFPEKINSLELFRPSGRTQGKIRLKLEIKKRPIQPQNYPYAPQGNSYYSPAPIASPAPHRDYRDFSPSLYPFPDDYYSRFYYPPPPPPPRAMYDRASNYSLPSVPSAPVDHNPLPRFPNYAPPPSGPPPQAPVDAFPANEAPQPSGPPSAPVDAFPVNEVPPVASRFPSYGVPGGPSAPVDYSPYDHRQLQRTMGGMSLGEERAVAERSSESEFGARPSCSYARDYRREC